MDSNEYPAMANWGGWRSEQDSEGSWAMKQWIDMNTGGLFPSSHEYRPYTATEIDLRRMEYERRQQEAQQQQQMQYSQLQQMYQQVMQKEDPEKELLESVHSRGKFYKMILLQELSVA